MSELPDLSAQKPYALDQLAQLQSKIVRLSQSMVLQRARIERCRQSDLAAARDIYAELSKTREALVEALAQTQLFLMEMEEYALAKVSGQLRQGLAGFALMSTGYKSVYEALSRFASSLPVGQKTNAAVVGRLMNNIKLGYYPTDPDNIDLLLRGIKFPEGVTTNLLDPCCGCGKALRQLAQGNNCYPDVVSVKQMCIMLGGISMKTAYKLLGNGEIHHLKIGKSFKIPKICVIEYLLG